jgi:cold shock CspA family protein
LAASILQWCLKPSAKRLIELADFPGSKSSPYRTPTSASSSRMSGVKRLTNLFRNVRDDDGGEVLVHGEAVHRAGLTSLYVGQRLSFDLMPCDRGRKPGIRAEKLRPI